MKQLDKIFLSFLLLLMVNYVFAQNEPLIVQAESGALGADVSTLTAGSVQYVTVVSDGAGDNPVSAARVATYTITFPAAGTYDLYMRVRVGPGGGNDDSYFYASGFGSRTFTNAQWITVNNIASGGFTAPDDIITGTGSAGQGVWKWIKLSGNNFGEAGVTFTVPAGSLTQTFQIGGRENGLDIDKIAFTGNGLFFTVNMLDNGLPGSTSPPGEKYPQTVQAESGTLGSAFTTSTISGVQYVGVTTSGGGGNPADNTRTVTYTITFPFAGVYDLYARIRVGANAGDDDSFFYGNGFGTKNATNDADWITVNGLSNVGYTGANDFVQGAGTAGINTNKWINLSKFNGGETPIQFTVPAGSLTQTFQIGGREDGLLIDKFVFAKSNVAFSVSNLDNVQQGVTDPPFTPTGVPIAKGLSKFLGSAYSGPQAPFFANYWNQVTPENGGKWGSVEGTRNVMNWNELDAAYNFAKANGFVYKHHTLIWGSQQPTWIENLPPAEQLAEIEQWFSLVAARYPDLPLIDVVNEPLPGHNQPIGAGKGNYYNALGGAGATGWDWVIKSFQLARQYFPNSKLLLNDFSIINDNNATTTYLTIINLLKERGLIDGIGDQGHAFQWTGTASSTITNNLNRLAATGLPIYITELDIDGLDDQVQLNEYKRIFPLLWDHPSVKGVTLWGWRLGHWRTAQGDYLVNVNGSERPALVWLREFVTLPVVTAGQTFNVSEKAVTGTAFGTVLATDLGPNTVFQNWQITGGTGSSAFAINSTTGQLTMLNNASLDFESGTRSYTLTITVSDSYHTSTSETVTVNLINANDNAPIVRPGISFSLDGGTCSELGIVTATDADDMNQPGFTSFQNWQIAGGSGAGIFAISPSTGMITIADLTHADLNSNSYTLMVTVSDGVNTSAPQTVTVTIPNKITVCHKGQLISVSKMAAIGHIQHGDCIGTCSQPTTNTRLSVEQNLLQAAGIRVYPNPVTDQLAIELGVNNHHIRTVELIDMAGRTVIRMDVKSSSVKLSKGQLKPGSYILQLKGDKLLSKQVMIQ